MKLKELAKIVAGKVVGNGNINIKGIALPEKASKHDLVFVFEQKFLPAAFQSNAAALVLGKKNKTNNKTALLVENPRRALAQILPLFAPKTRKQKGIHQSAVIPKSCKIGKNVSIGPYVVLGENVSIGDRTTILSQDFIGDETKIGKDCTIHPHVTIYDRVEIGDRVILHSGARIGVDGYGYVQQEGKHIKILHIGKVIIEDDVELYANVCVSRAAIDATIIGAGTKIDNLTHVAHNCKIGKDCAIVSLVGFAGSVTLKDRVYVAGQSGFGGHLTVGENTIVMGKSGVTKDLPANAVVSGYPAQDHRKEMAYQASLRRLTKKAK